MTFKREYALQRAIDVAAAQPLQVCAVMCGSAESRDSMFNRAVEIGGNLLLEVQRDTYTIVLPNHSRVEFIYSPFQGLPLNWAEIDAQYIVDMEHNGTREGE